MGLRVGVLGTGAIGTDHAMMLATIIGGATVVALFDVDTARAAELAERIGARRHDTATGVIDDAGVDAVVIASPGTAHAEQVLACIAAGKPVLCEKPLASTVDDAARVVAAEAGVGRRLVQVGFMRRFDPGYVAVKATIASGRIGTPLIVHCVHRNRSVPAGFTNAMAMTDTMVHEIDIVRWLLDDEIVSVRVVRGRRGPHAVDDHDDPQLALMTTASGVLAEVEVILHWPPGYDVRCEVVGSDGLATLEHPRVVSTTTTGSRSEAVPDGWQTRFGDTYRIELQAWVAATLAGNVVGASAWDGYAATVVAHAAVAAQGAAGEVAVQLIDRPMLYR
jgi:myo-inositol 2-dehydrogenase / D-chiro-inositol 1-dehydrogenase